VHALPKFICHMEETWLKEANSFSYEMYCWKSKMTLETMLTLSTTRCTICATACLIPVLISVIAFYYNAPFEKILAIAKNSIIVSVCNHKWKNNYYRKILPTYQKIGTNFLTYYITIFCNF
jgi:hypothetical protein